MKLFNIEFSVETMDFFAITPFIAIGGALAIAWLKWGITIKITRK